MSESGLMKRKENAAIWWCVLTCLSLCAIILMLFPLVSITTSVSRNFNEGWNSYRDQMAADGIPLYAAPPSINITNYPFLSFHIVGLLSRIIGNVTVTGRAVALVSAIATSLLVSAICGRLTRSWRSGMFAGLCFFVWLDTYSPVRRAMDDPHLLAIVFTTFGFYAFVCSSKRNGWLAISAVAFTAAVFTKNNLIGFPIAVALNLLLQRRWRGFLLWAVIGIATACVLLFLTFTIDGPYFFSHVLLSRSYNIVHGFTASFDFAAWFYVPLTIALGWFFWEKPSSTRSVLMITLLVTVGTDSLFAFGSGVDNNIFFDSIVALAVVMAFAMASLESALSQNSWRPAVFATLVVLPALTGIIYVPRQIYSDAKLLRDLPRLEADTARGISTLKQLSGPTLCENLLLCFEAQKPMEADANFVQDQIRLGRISESDILTRLQTQYYAAVEIGEEPTRDTITAESPQKRFSPAFMAALFNRYHPILQTARFSIFVPR